MYPLWRPGDNCWMNMNSVVNKIFLKIAGAQWKKSGMILNQSRPFSPRLHPNSSEMYCSVLLFNSKQRGKKGCQRFFFPSTCSIYSRIFRLFFQAFFLFLPWHCNSHKRSPVIPSKVSQGHDSLSTIYSQLSFCHCWKAVFANQLL